MSLKHSIIYLSSKKESVHIYREDGIHMEVDAVVPGFGEINFEFDFTEDQSAIVDHAMGIATDRDRFNREFGEAIKLAVPWTDPDDMLEKVRNELFKRRGKL